MGICLFTRLPSVQDWHKVGSARALALGVTQVLGLCLCPPRCFVPMELGVVSVERIVGAKNSIGAQLVTSLSGIWSPRCWLTVPVKANTEKCG